MSQKPIITLTDFFMEEESNNEDFYFEDNLFSSLEDDEISANEEGFMQGYLKA